MNTKPNDGGPAFPTLKSVAFENPNNFEITRYDLKEGKPGMSLRAYFAGQALQGIAANDHFIQTCIDMALEEKITPESVIAERAVKMANALIAELSKETP